MVRVQTLSSQLVKPARASSCVEDDDGGPVVVIGSSNLDLVVLNVYIKTIYVYAPPSSQSASPDFFCPDVLTPALAQALAIYAPVAGRLARKGERRIEIICNDAGVLFVCARADCFLSDLHGFEPKRELLDLIPSLDSFPDESTQPLFIVQVTKFECGGVIVGMGVEHHVADGMSAMAFLDAWASFAFTRAGAGGSTNVMAEHCSVRPPPCFDREVWLKARSPPTPLYPHHEYLLLPPRPPASITNPPNTLRDNNIMARIFDFPKGFPQTLKQIISSSAAAGFSTFELMVAHIWRCVCKARMLGHEQHSMLITLVDGRTRLTNPPLPEAFFGNVIFTSCARERVGALAGLGLEHSANVVRLGIRAADDAYCRSAIDFLELQPDLSKFIKGAHTFASPNLGLISWTKLPMHDTDFGWGKPIHVGPAYMPWEGHAYLLAAPPQLQMASFRLFIALPPHHMLPFSHLIFQPPNP